MPDAVIPDPEKSDQNQPRSCVLQYMLHHLQYLERLCITSPDSSVGYIFEHPHINDKRWNVPNLRVLNMVCYVACANCCANIRIKNMSRMSADVPRELIRSASNLEVLLAAHCGAAAYVAHQVRNCFSSGNFNRIWLQDVRNFEF